MTDLAVPQLLLDASSEPPLVAGVPAVLRTAHQLAAGHRVHRIVLWTSSPGFVASWRSRLAPLPWREVASYDGSRSLAEQIDADAPLLVLAPDGMPNPASLTGFLSESKAKQGPTAWMWNGAAVAAYYPEASHFVQRLPLGRRDFPRQPLAPPEAQRLPAPQAAWQTLGDAEAVRRAEDRLFQSLRQETDGYLARLDRALSIGLSRLLVRTPLTPNTITAFSLILGLLGAALLASPGYGVALLGAALLASCCVLDGCDGEVARLKLLVSSWGARFDIIADNVVNLAMFAAVAVHVHRLHPGLDVGTPAAVLLVGVLLSTFSVWWVILRQPKERRAGPQRVYERIASRDFTYLILLLAAVRGLEWFLWGAAVGANLFWLSLWWVSRKAPPR